MSASAIADGIITQLSATSALGSGAVDTNYHVLERISACAAAVVSWNRFEEHDITFGGSGETMWTFSAEGFVKDTGDPDTATTGVQACADTIISAVRTDKTLQGTCEEVTAIRGSHTPGEYLVTGGATWLPIRVEIDVREWT